MKLTYIDSLRGIAIFLVLVIHAANYGSYGEIEYSNWFTQLTNLGSSGVQLFFVVSAFTLILSYNYRKNKEVHYVRNFFIRRYVRLAPLYYLAIFYFLWQNRLGPRWWTGYEVGIEWSNILSNFFFINWVNPYWINSLVPGGWSISVEVSFYLLVPMLLIWIKKLHQAINFTIISFILGSVVTSYFSQHQLIGNETLWQAYLGLYFPSQFFVFGFGFIAYFVIIKRDCELSLTNKLLFPSLVLYCIIFTPETKNLVFGITFLVAVLALAKWDVKLFVNRYTAYLGKVSYSSYVVHFIVIHWMNKFGFQDYLAPYITEYVYAEYMIRLALLTFITVSISKYSFTYIESPFIHWGKRFIDSLNNSNEPSFIHSFLTSLRSSYSKQN